MSKSRSMRLLSGLGAAAIADGRRTFNFLPRRNALARVDAAAASVFSPSLLNTGVTWIS